MQKENKVSNIEYINLSNEWAKLDKVEYDYTFESGEQKRISRECYNRGNGAAILLFNRRKKSVILTRQFRMPIHVNNTNEAISIEVCAGAIDNNDTPLETIIRETEEEVGYKIKDAKHVLMAYTSPGALTEKMYLFVAEYSDAQKVNNGGGLDAENEEIEVLELPFTKAIEIIKSEKIIDAKTILLLQYAQINKLLD
ncbi:NUDIX domain-containing protein [Winogradskyella sp.]|uniref:NUDIX domain-containing protein n=1 Tax=Winogradskyella sp. TaxID=1883156 RepID=UPI003F6B5E4E